MDFARVGIDQGMLDHRYVNLLTQYSVGEWYRREFMNAAGTDDQPLPGNLTKHWSTYGARGLLAQTHAPMTGTWPLASDVLHGEIVLNDHLGSPRLRLESQLLAVVDEEGEDPTDVLDWVVAGWAPRNPMDYTPFGRELPLSAEAKTTPEGYTGKPLDLTFGLQAMNYGARFYDPRLGRWWQRDPLAEKYWWHSPYLYSGDSPVLQKDVDGQWYVVTVFVEDRSIPGLSTLYTRDGRPVVTWECLGRGTGGDWNRERGNTPTGVWPIAGDRIDGSNPAWFNLHGIDDASYGRAPRLVLGKPISGNAQLADMNKWRSTMNEIRYHCIGSDRDKKYKGELQPTWGCVRSSIVDQWSFFANVFLIEAQDPSEKPQTAEVIEIEMIGPPEQE
jgi:RHS repeat-associated protein